MEDKYNLKLALYTMLFLVLIIIGCNLTVQKLIDITGREIQPFLYGKVVEDFIEINLMDDQIRLSLVPFTEKGQIVKIYIQNSWANVKLSVAPRVNFISDIWQQGVEQLNHDVSSVFFGNQ